MKRIMVPTTSHTDWQRLLAQPERQWKEGHSAMTLALAWENAAPQGFPREVASILSSNPAPQFQNLSLLLAMPEYEVDLPGGQRPSQTDVMAIARGDQGLIVVAVEGKVDEPFGPTLEEKRESPSSGFEERLQFLLGSLELSPDVPGHARYQLLHRAVSALIVTEQFRASAAVMLVQSFSQTDMWFEDFSRFVQLLGAEAKIGRLESVGVRRGIPLFVGWCHGGR